MEENKKPKYVYYLAEEVHTDGDIFLDSLKPVIIKPQYTEDESLNGTLIFDSKKKNDESPDNSNASDDVSPVS